MSVLNPAPSFSAVHTIVQLTPETLGTAAKAARASGQSFDSWLADVIERGSSVADGHLEAPWDRSSMVLFAAVASSAPGVFEGRWRTLFDLVAADASLWRKVEPTLAEIDAGLAPDEVPAVDIEALAWRWAALVARVYSGSTVSRRIA